MTQSKCGQEFASLLFGHGACDMKPFCPHPLVRGGHAQTLLGMSLPYKYRPYTAVRHFAPLEDGDQLVLHDDLPVGWKPGDRVALLVHGLGGDHRSPYVRRAAEKLSDLGVRCMRLDLRGCGAGEPHSRGGAHGASWPDLAVAIERIARLAPGSPLALVGYSLGGALAINLAGELGNLQCGGLTSVLAVCPPLDLGAVAQRFNTFTGRVYDRHFSGMMWKHITRRVDAMEDPPVVDLSRRPRRLRDLDEWITAPFNGFRDAAAYYQHSNAGPRLASIRIPAKIILAADDPVIPTEPLLDYAHSSHVETQVTRSGGHLGFLGRRGVDPDLRWLDWRVVEWVLRTTSNQSAGVDYLIGEGAPTPETPEQGPAVAMPVKL